MKFAGSWVVDPWTDEIRNEMVLGMGVHVVSRDGESRTMQRAILCGRIDDAGRVQWCASGSRGVGSEFFRDAINVWVTARSVGDAVRAAHAVLMFTPPDTMTDLPV